jgi:hypothetical protein
MQSIMKPRILKVSNSGDFYKKEEIPHIKLQGKWLKAAGIETHSTVSVVNPEPGVLVLKVIPTSETQSHVYQ